MEPASHICRIAERPVSWKWRGRDSGEVETGGKEGSLDTALQAIVGTLAFFSE